MSTDKTINHNSALSLLLSAEKMEMRKWKVLVVFSFLVIFYIYFLTNLYSRISHEKKIDVFNSSFNTEKSIQIRLKRFTNKIRQAKKGIFSYQTRRFLILTYTSWFGGAWPIYSSSKCSFNTSMFQMTQNKELLNISQVVMFHSRDMPSIQELEKLNSFRGKEQLWIYFTMESIYNNPSVYNIDQYFNATATYGTDTDIPMPYRYHSRKHHVNDSISKNYFLNKKNMVVWLVSNCHCYARNELALKLMSYGVDIKIIGKCSGFFSRKLSSMCKNKLCFKPVFQQYFKQYLRSFKFFFSAENSLCDGYITEKYWESGLDNELIPIVLGGSNYSDPKLAIPGSFIDAMSFDSPKALANYILDVSSNSTKYNSFFEWKKNWQLDSSSRFCMLCDKLRKGFNLRANPLIKTMDIEKCIKPQEKFNIWINKS
ncbi:4-galactosyl-N-acetylglucosaminide 3-alpha-L-fucosyltransferase 9 isoform X2 [Hydra vulgaris]|uniref:4-galactosyl-N-acetylglucosaminide 3-alpha-L-fucosyltransferase 9 isoform X2 n=1 Tax=Hydra vulgaris TaxID=6087 RepID=UPI001F5F2C03|nr:4-galactosyl-N-acetylglucosaminide 3-alpha-L-fucosyltransferase 9-like isoform X2 [Hydra vulgaris]